MVQSTLRWLLPLLAMLVLGPLAGRLTASLRAVDGGADATLLVCANPSAGMVAGLGAIGLAAVAGVLAAVMIGNRLGLFSAGLVLAWASWGTGRVDAMIGRAQSGSVLKQLALEGLFVGALGVAVATLILLIPVRRVVSDGVAAGHALPPEPRSIRDKAGPLGAIAAFVVGAVVVWLLAQETLKGQTFAAATVAGLLGAATGRVVAPHASAMWFFLGLATLACVSPMLALVINGSGAGASMDGVVRAALAGGLFRLANPLPLDYLAGAFVGVPMGLAWAGSMVERHQPQGQVKSV